MVLSVQGCLCILSQICLTGMKNGFVGQCAAESFQGEEIYYFIETI